MNDIKPIETCWKGYRFRSRLEARWAVFFDRLGIEYKYEPEGFDLGTAGHYLPDFWLPHYIEEAAAQGWGVWCEIKPFQATADEQEKFVALCAATKHNGFLLQGSCGEGEYIVCRVESTHHDPPIVRPAVESVIRFRSFLACHVRFDGNRVVKAYRAARSARFEHGEKP